MKYNIEINLNKNINKYNCIIIFINKKNILKCKIYKKLIKKKINKHKYIIKKYNVYEIIDINKKQDIILIGSNFNKINSNIFKKLIIITLKFINKKKYKNIIYLFENLKIKNIYWKIFNSIKIIEYKTYKFNKFKKNKNIKKKYIFFNIKKKNKKKSLKYINKSYIISKSIKINRDICNMPSNICNSNYIFNKVKKYIYGKNINISYLNEKKMKKIGMNSYLSVNKGSINKLKLIKIKYKNNKKKKPIIIIGKGITFDSGGISIKTSRQMKDMKFDMSGAAIVLSIMYIINKLKLKLNIIGILCCAENMIHNNSNKPGDIIKSLSGKTIEIINTDAEGRLILCDTLSYINKYNPKLVISIATLTGSCIYALGKKITALITNNKKISKKLIKISKKCKDYIWELPLFKKYNKYLKSNIADIKNCNDEYYADTIISACFLNKFIKKYKWAHLDIAGTASNNKGSTGRTIYLIIKFLEKYFN